MDAVLKKHSKSHWAPAKAKQAKRKARAELLRLERHERTSAKRKWHDFNKYTRFV